MNSYSTKARVRTWAFALFAFVAAFPCELPAFDGVYGTQLYPPSVTGGWGQTFQVVQDSMGYLYAADLKGVLVYDGVRWEVVLHPERRAPLSMDIAADGRVYVGLNNDIGILYPDSSGVPIIHSLRNTLPEHLAEIGDVWITRVAPEGVYFQGEYALLRWTPDPANPLAGVMKVWEFPEPNWIGLFARVYGRNYVVEPEKGLQELIGDELVAVEGGELFEDIYVLRIIPFSEGRVLVMAANWDDSSHWLLYDGVKFSEFRGEVTEFSSANEGWDAVPIGGGRYALATYKGGVVLFDESGNILRHLDRESGLLDNATQNVYLDDDRNLWICMNYGLARVDISTPVEHLDSRQGIEGNIFDLAMFQGRLYVASDQGVFYSDESQSPTLFHRLPGVHDWVWQLLPWDDRLLIAAYSGLFELRAGNTSATSLDDSYYLESMARAQDGEHLLLGTGYQGLHVMHLEGGRWVYDGQAANWNKGIRLITPREDGKYWISYGDEALKLVDISFDGESPNLVSEETFGVSNGLPIPDYYEPVRIGAHWYAAGLLGLNLFDPVLQRFEPVELVDESGLNQQIDVANPLVDTDGSLWFTSETMPLGKASPLSLNRFHFQAIRLGGALSQSSSLHFENDSTLWVGGEIGRLAQLSTREWRDHTSHNAPVIHRITHKEKQLYHYLAGAQPRITLPYAMNSVDIQFSLPQFGSSESNEYQYQLVGLDEHWSEWSTQSSLSFSHLPVGTYRFEVRSRHPMGEPTAPAQFEFTIIPPWYRSSFALIAYVMLISGAIYTIVRRRMRSLVSQKRQLERLLDERAREAVEQVEKTRKVEVEAQQMRTASQLAATIAHEFNTPLAVLKGISDLHELKPFTENEIGPIAQKINRQVGKMSDLVEKLLRLRELREIDYAAGVKILDLHYPDRLNSFVNGSPGEAEEEDGSPESPGN